MRAPRSDRRSDHRTGVCVEQLLAPTLTRSDIVMMDDLSMGRRETNEAAGAPLLYLPRRSPD